MRWTSRSWLWSLLAVLLFGLVLMHHAPSHGGHHSESVVVATDAIPAAVNSAMVAGVTMTDSGGADCSCSVRDHHAALPGRSGDSDLTVLLHLCLAVLAAAGGLLSAGFLLRWTTSQGGDIATLGRRIGLDHLRPPVSVPRRLAALCVLRL